MSDGQLTDKQFYNRSQKPKETENAFANKLQILVCKIVAHKLEFLGEAYQAFKHEYVHNLHDPCFEVMARGQCLMSADSGSFTQLRGSLTLTFGSQGKHGKQFSAKTSTVSMEQTNEDTPETP